MGYGSPGSRRWEGSRREPASSPGWAARCALLERRSCFRLLCLQPICHTVGSPRVDSEDYSASIYWKVQGIWVDKKGGNLRKERQRIKEELLIWLPQGATGDEFMVENFEKYTPQTYPKGWGTWESYTPMPIGEMLTFRHQIGGYSVKPEGRPLTKMWVWLPEVRLVCTEGVRDLQIMAGAWRNLARPSGLLQNPENLAPGPQIPKNPRGPLWLLTCPCSDIKSVPKFSHFSSVTFHILSILNILIHFTWTIYPLHKGLFPAHWARCWGCTVNTHMEVAVWTL